VDQSRGRTGQAAENLAAKQQLAINFGRLNKINETTKNDGAHCLDPDHLRRLLATRGAHASG